MNEDNASNNRRIAKNTIVLFLRMLLVLGVALFTSRVVLQILGVEDFGIYNVVGGLVIMFSTISAPISNTVSRFLTFELGTGNREKLAKVFSTSISVQIILSLVVVIVAEVVGLWFLNFKMNIAPERLEAANWVFQCSVVSFVISLVSSPYNAAIIAHEKMSVFAYVTIFEVLLKLAVVYALYISGFDKLVAYAILLVFVSLLMRIIYGVYCKRNFEECTWHPVFDKKLIKEMCSFAGWNFFGNTAYILNTQGVNMLINIFFGVTFNAARGIAQQADAAIMQLVNNFTTALNPQITKSYAKGNIEYMSSLINHGTKYSYFLMYLISVPVVIEADTILKIWLVNPPEDTALFLRLAIYGSLMSLLGNAMFTAIMATGKIKRYQFEVTAFGCLVFPLVWIAYYFGFSVEWAYIIYIVIYFLLNGIRCSTLKRLVNFSTGNFIKQAMVPIFIVSFASYALPLLIPYYFEPSFLRLLLTTAVSVPFTALCIWCFGLSPQERNFASSKLMTIIRCKLKRR